MSQRVSVCPLTLRNAMRELRLYKSVKWANDRFCAIKASSKINDESTVPRQRLVVLQLEGPQGLTATTNEPAGQVRQDGLDVGRGSPSKYGAYIDFLLDHFASYHVSGAWR